jgi:hypothetical protein
MEGKTMTQHSVIKAMGGGLLGTLAQVLTVYGAVPLLTAGSIDMAALLQRVCDVGMLAQVFTGAILFPLGYMALASQSFPGTPVLKGMLWAGLLWVMAEAIMAPVLGAGIFSAELGGLPAAGRALLGYLAYGATLGGIAGLAEPEGQYTSGGYVPARARWTWLSGSTAALAVIPLHSRKPRR